MWWNKYINTPFVEKGRDASGVDCWGLVKIIYQKERNIILPDYTEYYQTTQDRDILAKTIREERSTKWLDVNEPKMFDVIILKMGGVPMHVGIVTKPNFMIHSARGIGTTHESFANIKWKHKVIGFSRYAEK